MITIRLEYYAQLRDQAGTGMERWSAAAATVAELYEELRARHGFGLPGRMLRAAVNAEFSEWTRPLRDGDTIVFIPPVSRRVTHFDVSAAAIDPAALRPALQRADSGAFCTFEGWVRDHNEGRAVSGLEYQVYLELALREGGCIVDEAIRRFGIADAYCVHRSGRLAIGDLAVWVGVAAGHRGEAFAACRYIIDEIKHRLPVWKREHYLDGDTAWVSCASHAHDGHRHGG